MLPLSNFDLLDYSGFGPGQWYVRCLGKSNREGDRDDLRSLAERRGDGRPRPSSRAGRPASMARGLSSLGLERKRRLPGNCRENQFLIFQDFVEGSLVLLDDALVGNDGLLVLHDCALVGQDGFLVSYDVAWLDRIVF